MTVRVENDHIVISFGDEDERLTPTEARRLADELLVAADKCERQQRETEATCERDGHDWGPWLNGYAPFRNHARRCQRGCWFGHEQEPGWMPFAGLPHGTLWGQPLECCGPGCEHCDTKKLGQIIQRMSAEALQRLDAFVFGETETATDQHRNDNADSRVR
ncbi:hypothetical protein Cme02nite_38320 [Catellatospora methionotrophica]|uniref:Uncharacterized protein n=1 Tax=Catellatospora methionotrophica TaxID=121620 RepID=A0A8J3LB41_9ACTN|nr:hypothetical protein [Catellatospora methionotrophica]GIG15500.1 hypothetical protein Cme02nite_38320 [Catellatospora methionotrophica]